MAEPWALVADPGIDDAVALAVLAGSGEVPDLVVSEPGNVSGAVAARNAAGLVVLLGLTCPVAAHEIDAPPAVRPGRSSRHGDDGLGGVADRLPPAPAPGPVAGLPLSFLVTGPLAAVEGVEEVERLVWMGGALGSGNITAAAEFNAWCAPAAADDVFQRHGAATSVVPLDVTTQVPLGEQELEAWSGAGSRPGCWPTPCACALTGVGPSSTTPSPRWPGCVPGCSAGIATRCGASPTVTTAVEWWPSQAGRRRWWSTSTARRSGVS